VRKYFLRRYLPDSSALHQYRGLRPFARWLGHPSLWHLNRRSTSTGFAIGLSMNFLPIPFPMIPALAITVGLRANVPATILGAWMRNPFTISLFALLSYQVGAWILGTPARALAFEMSWEWITGALAQIWAPFLLGCVVAGSASALLSYAVIRLLWRWQVVRAWRRRQANRRATAHAVRHPQA